MAESNDAMSFVLGDHDCQASVFIFKDDDSVAEAQDQSRAIIDKGQPIRIEQHRTKADFLSGLSKWNGQDDSDSLNAFLCVYAHMGAPGLAPRQAAGEDLTSWNELAEALPKGVELLWLLGCNSDECISSWNPLVSPVHSMLLVTSEKKYFASMIKAFAHEICMSPITQYDEMPALLKQKYPDLAQHTKYFRKQDGKWEELH